MNEHSLRQVCHTRTSNGESRAFLWQPLRFLAHMAVRHSPERSWISNHNKSEASPPLWSGGNRADPEASPRPSALTERSWTARLPTARLPFCVGGKDRSGSTERSFFFSCRRRATARKHEPSLRNLFQICTHCTEKRMCTNPRTIRGSFGSALPPVFPRHDKQQRAAPTWPDRGDCAPIEAQH